MNPVGLFLNPLGLFLRTSIPFMWRVLSAFLPARTPWLRGPVSPRYDEPSDVITALIFAAVTLSIALYARR